MSIILPNLHENHQDNTTRQEYLTIVGPIINVDKSSPQEIERLLKHIQLTKPMFVTLIADFKFSEARDIGLTLQKNDPAPRIILVKYPNRLAWKDPNYRDPDRWYETYQSLITENFLVQTSSGERFAHLIDDYYLWNARIIKLAGDEGYGVAVGTHEPLNSASGYNRSLVETLHEYHDYSIWNPVEYFTLSPERGSDTRHAFSRFWSDFGDLLRPVTVLSDFGLRVNADPDLNWRFIPGLTGADYFTDHVQPQLIHYVSHGVNVQVPHIDEGFMQALEHHVTIDPLGISPTWSKTKRILPEPEIMFVEPEIEKMEVVEDIESIVIDLSQLHELINRRALPRSIEIRLNYGIKEED